MPPLPGDEAMKMVAESCGVKPNQGNTVGSNGYLDILRPLIMLTVSMVGLMKEELRLFRPVLEKDWPLPRGYRIRIAPGCAPTARR